MHRSSTSGKQLAVVIDVAASWEHYGLVRRALAAAPVPGLLVHAAGPTDEGYRTIDVWASEADWRTFRRRLDEGYRDLSLPPLVRELRLHDLVQLMEDPCVSR